MRFSRTPQRRSPDQEAPAIVGAADCRSPQRSRADARMEARRSALQLRRGQGTYSFRAFGGRGERRGESAFSRPVSDQGVTGKLGYFATKLVNIFRTRPERSVEQPGNRFQ